MKRTWLLIVVIFAVAAKRDLPPLGTQFHPLPPGKGKRLVESSCLPCHSADILVQQRLSEKQWVSEVDKMIRWGAKVPEGDKTQVVAYLSRNFGPENRSFTPIRTKPVAGGR